MEPKPINAQITITATYDDLIRISVSDKTAGVRFLDMEVTRKQFIDATMNRLADTGVAKAEVRNLDKVGKRFEVQLLIVEIKGWRDKDEARRAARKECPKGWEPDLDFNENDSFYEENGKNFAKTRMRRWV